MRIAKEGRALGHLTYCTNIHAGEAWPDVKASLTEHLPLIKAATTPAAPLAIGLRIAASAADALSDAATLAELKALLGEDYYVFTINGFPYGTFHGQPVKDGAYKPDWSTPERLQYSNQLGHILAALLPEGMAGSISTVPVTFKPWLEAMTPMHATSYVAACVKNLLSHAAELWRIQRSTGATVTLALEPEPFCLLETINETVRFFEEHLFGESALSAFGAMTGLSEDDAKAALRTHLGVCYDVCHAAVEFEKPTASVVALKRAGIVISKVQLSSALKVQKIDAVSASALSAFDEPVYLHQTMQRNLSGITRFADLRPALDSLPHASGSEWRSHFHVPIFLERMEGFDTTQDFLREILALHAREPFTEQLEVETYTWDVLPEQYRGVPVSEAIARELNWVCTELGVEAQ